MARFLKDRSKAKGLVPGSLVLIGKQKMEKSIIQFMQIDTDSLVEEEVGSTREALEKLNPEAVNWINIYGIHDLDMIQNLGSEFELPGLLLEDILNTDQQPKYENGETYDAFIMKMMHQVGNSNRIHAEQITIILRKDCIITLQERRGDVFNPVRERIRKNKGRIRSHGNDYLAYALMDTIVDNYTILIESIGTKVEDLEDRLFRQMDTKIVEEIYQFKTELNYLRKSIRPVRDFLVLLNRTEDSYIQEKNRKFLADLYELAVQCTDAIELYNSLVSDQLNIYNSNMSNKMNEVMKTLTIFASIFIPLTFVAGIYGMNFRYMPELDYKYSYPILWGIILLLAGGLLYYFKRKKWL
ncbi:magnesium and cobalt transport protein CorA [Maribellus luteus]|uniref:Magnesium transport protein CorA n=1 Tax=Maribellus luteus TaxID=2305463 RepID=A0A399T4W7_9BACT|nr:magnesium/cobalt transporter CorA [Maribellus luteus]RIJ49247.1 magnesium and cobalt transport protein CorA [Maribellus luteus]